MNRSRFYAESLRRWIDKARRLARALPLDQQRRREEAERRLAEALAEIDRLGQRRG